MKSLSSLCMILLLIGGAQAGDEIAPEAYAGVNQSIFEHHVLPRYELLADKTARFADAVAKSCGDDNLGVLRESYQSVMDAWMGVQHLRFGPVELFMRAYRFYFWPEARGRIGDALGEVLARPEAPTSESLTDASVAVQGLPAVEYLLYEDSGLDGGNAKADSRCALLKAIAGNMRDMAAGIVTDWRGGDVDFEQSFLHPGPDNAFYKTHSDATLDLFKSLHGGLRLLVDIKLKPVIGEDTDSAHPELAESRRSGRTLRNIVVNLEALQALYLGEGGPGLSELVSKNGRDDELDPLMRKAFRKTLETARGIEPPFTRAITDTATRPETEKLLLQVLALKQIVKSRVASALGLAVGFNALDGD